MKWCRTCGRERRKGHMCDLALLSDGSIVHVSRIETGGDLHDKIGKKKGDLKVVNRWITNEMRSMRKKAGL